jgi:alcohol dehydrogenase
VTDHVKAAVLEEPERLRLRNLERPVPRDLGLLIRVEKCGICGSDPGYYRGRFPAAYPAVLGHEIVGIVDAVGPGAEDLHHVSVGDRVVIEFPIRCGKCWYCLTGDYRLCDAGLGYGGPLSIDVPPALWGGYAEYVYAGAESIVHRVPNGLAPELALLACAVLGNGIRWVRSAGGVTIGDSVLILGPGPQGLAATIAAREAGAATIIVAGLRQDEKWLDMATRLGATSTVTVDQDDLLSSVLNTTNGVLCDVVIDVTGSARSLPTALVAVRKLGTVVLAGMNGFRNVEFVQDLLVEKEVRLQGVNSHDMRTAIPALKLLASGKYPFSELITHTYSLAAAEEALLCAEGKAGDGKQAIKVVIDPWT